MPVLDASVLVEYLAGGEHAAPARERLRATEEAWWAPHLVDAEVGHVLRRAALVGELSERRARDALATLIVMPLQRAPHRPLLERAFSLRANMSFYDALYVALAERLQLPLLTFDARLAAVTRVKAPIEVLAAGEPNGG